MFPYPGYSEPNRLHADAPRLATTRPYPQYYKLVMRSLDRVSGSSKYNALFDQVRMPEAFSGPAVFVVESFSYSHDGGALDSPLLIHIPELKHQRSYDSRTGSLTNVVAVVPDIPRLTAPASVQSLGTPITDANFFRNTRLHVMITTPAGVSPEPRANETAPDEQTGLFTGDWVMVAYVVNLDDSVPL
jgi:hypothetical protein